MKGRRGRRDGVVLPSKGGNFQKLLHLHRMVKSSKVRSNSNRNKSGIFVIPKPPGTQKNPFRLSSGVSDLTVKTDLAV
ncbi:hypothetical protein J6590_097906 [Homalodisca vitripennis]|nr:hypothetical protein J6590_097906 [Homalodisca vitripennis]